MYLLLLSLLEELHLLFLLLVAFSLSLPLPLFFSLSISLFVLHVSSFGVERDLEHFQRVMEFPLATQR